MLTRDFGEKVGDIIGRCFGHELAIGERTQIDNCQLKNCLIQNDSYLENLTLEKAMIGNQVHYKGNSTFCLPNDDANPKVPFNIDMNYWISGQKLMGKKKIKLANAWMDPTFVKEFSASQIYKNYLKSQYAYLNSKCIAVHFVHENQL